MRNRDFMRWSVCCCIIIVGASLSEAADLKVSVPPEEVKQKFKLDPIYKKCVVTQGFPILASDKASDMALLEAAYIVDHMLAGRNDVRKAIVEQRIRLGVMAPTEMTLDIPEHSDLKPAGYWNKRARGLGATLVRPAVSCGEENLLACPGDPYKGENILVHEFAHVIHEIGMANVDKKFDARLKDAYDAAMKDGLWKNTYSATNHKEYWAEGAQAWFHCCREALEDKRVMNGRDELKKYDPGLAKLLDEVFHDNDWVYTLPEKRKELPHLAGYDAKKLPHFAWPKEVLEAWEKYEKEKK
jgi:hypothetical protein